MKYTQHHFCVSVVQFVCKLKFRDVCVLRSPRPHADVLPLSGPLFGKLFVICVALQLRHYYNLASSSVFLTCILCSFQCDLT